MKCVLCGSSQLEILAKPKIDVLVTGNRNFFRYSEGIERCICRKCGGLQRLQNAQYKQAVNKVFSNYGALHSKTFMDGKASLRENVIVERVIDALELPKQGDMLEIGCGEGESLGCFHSLRPEWNLCGMDIGEEFRESVISKTEGKYFTSLFDIIRSGQKFDLITMNFTFCVLNNQGETLELIKKLLTDTGVLFIIEANYEINPFALNVVEAAASYTQASLKHACLMKGFDILDTRFVYEDKETWVFARKSKRELKNILSIYNSNKKIYMNTISYLDHVIDIVYEYGKDNKNIAIFGMHLAGIWIMEVMEKLGVHENKNIVWVDEDDEVLERGTGLNGYPICRIEDIQSETIVFLPFPDYVARDIMKRYSELGRNIIFICFGDCVHAN